MSPEQAEGDIEHLGPRSDVYSLGGTLYYLLTGRPPLEGDIAEVLHAAQRGEFPPPRRHNSAIDPALEAVCLKAMAHRPAERYASPRALSEDIERWMADEPVSAHREPWLARLGRWTRRHRPLVSGAAALLVTAVVALGVSLIVIRRERDRADAARGLALANFEIAEAQRRRALANFRKARDAVDRMLTRVGDRSLRHVPQMESLRQRLLEDALEFNRDFLREEGDDPDVRRETARAYRRAAQVHEMLGRSNDADEEYARAVALAEAVAASAPRVPSDRLDLAEHLDHRARFLADCGRPAEAEAHWVRAEVLLRALAAASPEDPRPRRSLGFVDHNRGTMFYKLGRHAEAERALRAAIATREALADAEPGDLDLQFQVASGYNNLANLLEAMTRMADAEAVHRRALARLERLVARAPDNPEYRGFWAISLGNLGLLLKSIGRAPEAEANYRRALEIHRGLTADFPDTIDYKFRLAALFHNLGLVLEELGRIPDAEAADRESARLWEELVSRAPSIPEYRDNQAHVQNTLGNLWKDQGRNDEAEAAYRRAREIWGRLTAEYPTVPNYREGAAHVDNNLAIVLEVARGRVAEAERMYPAPSRPGRPWWPTTPRRRSIATSWRRPTPTWPTS
jgi:tetratricopeptide (TPR) repeat protein